MPNSKIVTVSCPYCETEIRGTVQDIDSGLRKHLDYCDKRPEEEAAKPEGPGTL